MFLSCNIQAWNVDWCYSDTWEHFLSILHSHLSSWVSFVHTYPTLKAPISQATKRKWWVIRSISGLTMVTTVYTQHTRSATCLNTTFFKSLHRRQNPQSAITKDSHKGFRTGVRTCHCLRLRKRRVLCHENVRCHRRSGHITLSHLDVGSRVVPSTYYDIEEVIFSIEQTRKIKHTYSANNTRTKKLSLLMSKPCRLVQYLQSSLINWNRFYPVWGTSSAIEL